MDIENKIAKLISTSGNSFHSKVASWLKEHGWSVAVSPYYLEQTLGKAREIDIIAEKVMTRRGSYQHQGVLVLVRLFVECKYVGVPSVFWFAEKEREAAEKLVCRSGKFRMDNTQTLDHHYLLGSEVAKIFASASSKDAENEPFYKALNQVISAKVSMRGRKSIVKDLPEHDRYKLVVLEFPVVLCNSFEVLRRVSFYGASSPALISDRFQLEVQYAYVDHASTSRDEYFILDFVEFQHLAEFEKLLKRDAEIASHLA